MVHARISIAILRFLFKTCYEDIVDLTVVVLFRASLTDSSGKTVFVAVVVFNESSSPFQSTDTWYGSTGLTGTLLAIEKQRVVKSSYF